MKLYQLAHSPFCIPISRALEAAEIPFEAVEVPNHDRSTLLRLTSGAYYQVPVLEHEEKIIFESGTDTQDVARYVDGLCAGRLFPARLEGHQALILPYLENDVEGVTFKLCDIHYVPQIADPIERGLNIRHKERKFGRGCVDTWRREKDALWTTALEKLKPFDQILAHSPYVLGEAPVYVDFLLFGTLENLTFAGANPFPPLSHLQQWHERLRTFRF